MSRIRKVAGIGVPFRDLFPAPVVGSRAPTTADTNYDLGQVWIRTTTNQAWTLTSVSSGSANWALSSPGASDVDTINSLSPTAGNIIIDGGTNITDSNAGSTVTLNLDAAITLATSVTSPIYTSTGADTNINSAAGQDLILQMGDAAAANKVSFETNASAEVASIDSAGTATFVNMDGIIGATTPAAATFTTATANTSVVSALYTTAAASDLLITSIAGQDIIIKMGDGAAANKVSFTDTADAEVASIDSNGAFTTTGLTFTGLLTANASATINTAGTALNLGSDNSGDAVNLGVGTVARAIGIGNSAAAHTITIGSVTGACSLDLLAGTGNFTLEGNVATTYAISNTGVNTGQVDIAGGTGARTINIGGGGTGAKTINIGAAASADLITIGDATGAGSLDLVCGTGNFTLEGNVASTYNISATGANTGTVTIGAGTGARIVNLATGAGGVKTVNLATGAIGNIVTIGTVTAAASLDLLCGTGNFTLEGNVASTYDISNTGVNTGAVNIAGGTGARTITIGGGGTGAKTINIGAAASADLITIGDATGAGSLDLVCGTGNFTLEGNVASTYEISSTGVNTGTCKFASGTGARTVEIAGGGTGIKTVNIAAAATADVVTIGTTTGAGSLTLAAGTGDITMSGTVKEINAEFLFASGTDLTVTQSPLLQSNATTGVAPTGATGDLNLMYLQDGCLMEQFILGAGQTIIAPRMTANGLNIALDQTDNEGAEYNFGMRNNAKHTFVSQTAAAFFIEATVYLGDLSGCEPFWIGFRKVQANDADYTNYTDFYVIGINNATSATNVTVAGQINGAGITLTDTTDAWGGDAAAQTISVLVSSAGVITATVGGSAVTVPLAQTFDAGDVIAPFIHFLHDTDLAGEVGLQNLKIGFQA